MISENHSLSNERKRVFYYFANIDGGSLLNNWSYLNNCLNGLGLGSLLLAGAGSESWVLREGLLIDIKISENLVHLGLNLVLTLNHLKLLWSW